MPCVWVGALVAHTCTHIAELAGKKLKLIINKNTRSPERVREREDRLEVGGSYSKYSMNPTKRACNRGNACSLLNENI
jgi:hypothetical protein